MSLKTVGGYVMLLTLVLFCGCGKIDVAVYRTERFQEIKSKIATEPVWMTVMQKVLDERHGSVRAKSIEIEDVVVKTLGDDPYVLKTGENLLGVEVMFRINWDGMLHKDGYTCTRFIFDKDWNVTRIMPGESNAVIDLGGSGNAGLVLEAKDAAARKIHEATEQIDESMKSIRRKWEDEVKPKVDEGLKKVDERLMELEDQVNGLIRSTGGVK